ncbi:MAG: cell division protein FtsQ/DivIB [Bacteriovoracaceae bacterium]
MKILFYFISLSLSLLFAFPSFAAKNFLMRRNLNYQTNFGECAPRIAGDLSLILVKEFEKNHSLKEVKEKILSEKLVEKYYLAGYKIDYDPLSRSLKFDFECSLPLMKVQIYKGPNSQSYTAVLGTDGKLYDPGYEELMRKEGILSAPLPILAFPIEEMDKSLQFEVAGLVAKIPPDLRRNLSEVIVGAKKDLTMIFSYQGKPTSIFLGEEEWANKVVKVQKILNYMESKNKYPTVVNLTNLKKVVVKF